MLYNFSLILTKLLSPIFIRIEFLSSSRFPFDWQTPIGYLFSVSFMLVAHINIMWWLFNILFLFIGFVSILVLFSEQLRSEIDLMNMNIKEGDESLLNTKLCHIINLHCEAKQLNYIKMKSICQ